MIDSWPRPVARRTIRVRPARLNATLGTDISADAIVAYLAPIGFAATPDGDALVVEVPSFRPDAEREVDVIEEVARHHGYARIAPTLRRSPAVGLLTAHQAGRRRLASLVAGCGANEAWTSSIVNPETARQLGDPRAPVGLTNPVVREESALRTSLLPGLLGAARHNAAARNASVRLFEIGRVFGRPGGDGELPVEHEQLGVVLAGDGDDAPAAVHLWHRIVEGLGIDPGSVELAQDGPGARALLAGPGGFGCHPTRTAVLSGVAPDGTVGTVGTVGEVDPDVAAAYDLGTRRVGWLVLDTERLFALPHRNGHPPVLSRFPSSDIDLSFTLDESVPAARLEFVLRSAAGSTRERPPRRRLPRRRARSPVAQPHLPHPLRRAGSHAHRLRRRHAARPLHRRRRGRARGGTSRLIAVPVPRSGGMARAARSHAAVLARWGVVAVPTVLTLVLGVVDLDGRSIWLDEGDGLDHRPARRGARVGDGPRRRQHARLLRARPRSRRVVREQPCGAAPALGDRRRGDDGARRRPRPAVVLPPGRPRRRVVLGGEPARGALGAERPQLLADDGVRRRVESLVLCPRRPAGGRPWGLAGVRRLRGDDDARGVYELHRRPRHPRPARRARWPAPSGATRHRGGRHRRRDVRGRLPRSCGALRVRDNSSGCRARTLPRSARCFFRCLGGLPAELPPHRDG